MTDILQFPGKDDAIERSVLSLVEKREHLLDQMSSRLAELCDVERQIRQLYQAKAETIRERAFNQALE